MFLAYGKVEYRCDHCNKKYGFDASEVQFYQDGGGERSMGAELFYIWEWSDHCQKCNATNELTITVSEYPIGTLDNIDHDKTNVTDVKWPHVEQAYAYYELPDDVAQKVESSVVEIIQALQESPELVRDIDDRVFEEVVAELFRNAGFEVTLTAKSKDGGKDIVAIQKNVLGVNTKLFVECKRYAEDKPVGVAIVRAVYGVLNERDGPNKSIIVTTSGFTAGAKNFVEERATSQYDLDLVGFEKLIQWIKNYKPPQNRAER